MLLRTIGGKIVSAKEVNALPRYEMHRTMGDD